PCAAASPRRSRTAASWTAWWRLRATICREPPSRRRSDTRCSIDEPLERQLASVIDPERKRAIDGRAIAEGTPDELAGTLDVEDLPILLCLRASAGRLGQTPISLLVLDEAEDFSLFELAVARELPGAAASVT